MDSSLKNPSYDHWRPPSAPYPPIHPPAPTSSHQFYDRSTQSDRHHLNHHNYTHRFDFPPQSAANHPPPSYYSHPQPQPHLHPQPPALHTSYESPWIPQPSSNFSRDFPQSDWVGYMDPRNHQLDYWNRTSNFYNGVFPRDFDSYSRSLGGFHSIGYARQDVGESYRDSRQFKSESDGYCRYFGMGTSFGYGNDRYDAALHRGTFTNSTSNGGTVNQRWFKGTENDRSPRPAHFNEKRFSSLKGKDYSDWGSVKKQTLDQKETSSTAGEAILSKVASEGEITFACKSMSSLQSQPCEDEILEKDMGDLSSKNLQMEEVNDNSFSVEKNTITRVDYLDPTVVSQAESKHFSQSQDCENGVDSLDPAVVSQAESKHSAQSQDCKNGVDSLVEIISRKESFEITHLNSTVEVDQSIDSDAGKYTCIINMSSSPKNVAGKGSSNVQPVERTSVLMCSIGKNKEGGSNGSVVDRELSSTVFLEDVSFVSNQDLGLSSDGHADVPSMDQSCNLDCRVLKACSSDSNVSLTKDTNVGASEFQFNQEVRETALTCDSSPALEIDSSIAMGHMGNSCCKTVTDSECSPLETQPLSAGCNCKLLPNDHLGCGASDVVGSFLMSSVDKDRVDDPLRISSCLVPDSSVSLCHLSPSVVVSEELPNSASAIEPNCISQCDIIEEEGRRTDDMDVDIQEEKVKLTGETLQCRSLGTDFATIIGDPMFLCGSLSNLPGLLTGKIHNETQAVAEVDKTNSSEEHNKEGILLDASQEKIINFYETVQSGSSLGHFLGSDQTSHGTDAKSRELPMEKCGDGVLVENSGGEPIENLTNVPYDLGSQEISISIANTDVDVGEALSLGGKVFGTERPSNSDVLLSKLYLHADDKCAASHVKDYVVALPPPDSKSKKTQKKPKKFMHAAQKSHPRSLYEIQKNAKPPITVKKHHTWHRKSNNTASPMVSVKPKVIVQSDSTYVRKGNSLLRKPSPGFLGKISLGLPPSALQLNISTIEDKSMESVGPADNIYFLVKAGEAQNLQRHSSPPSDSTSSVKWALSPGRDPLANGLHGSSSGDADDQDIVRNGFKSFKTPFQIASDCQPKQNPPKLEFLYPSKLLYVKRKANQLVAASDIHGASNSKISPSEPLSRKAYRVRRGPQKIVPQPNPWKRATYWKRLGNPASSLLNSSFSIARTFHLVSMRKTTGYSLKQSKVLSTGGSHLKWYKSIERSSKKPEFLSNVESSHSGPSKSVKDTKISYIPKRSVWIRNRNQLVRDRKKRTRVLANEKVRWSLNNVRLRQAKKMKYCQFFTRFGKCNKDDGECPYIHDPSKIAVCTKFLSGLCASPDCKLTHKVVSESMPDCYYFLQGNIFAVRSLIFVEQETNTYNAGLCNNDPCPYRHVHVHQNAAICEGFLRGYCSDANECQKKHTYTCPVFEATGSCPQGSECKLHHPKNLSKGKKRKRESEPWQKKTSGRYFGSLHKHLPESPMLVNELSVDGEVFGGASPDFIRLDVNEQEASENMDSSTRESVSDDSEAQDWIYELIRPVGLMQKEVSVTPSEKVNFLDKTYSSSAMFLC